MAGIGSDPDRGGRHGGSGFGGRQRDRERAGNGGRGGGGGDRRGRSLLGDMLRDLAATRNPLRAPGRDDPGIVGTVAGIAGGPLIGGAVALGAAAAKAARDAGVEVTPYGRSRVGRLDRTEHQRPGGGSGGRDRSVLDAKAPAVRAPAEPSPVGPPNAGNPLDVGGRGRRRRRGTLLSGALGTRWLRPLE